MSWWDIFGEFFGDAVPSVIGLLLAFGGLYFVRAGVLWGRSEFTVVGAVAFLVGLIFLWIARLGQGE